MGKSIALASSCLAAGALAGAGAGAPSGGIPLARHSAGVERSSGRSSECVRDGLSCFRVSVPLDWSGARPGTRSLWVEEHVAPGVPRGVMFLLAGGPGQASSEVFYIGRDSYWQQTFPGYTLVAFDPRGTGASGRLTCRWAGSASHVAQSVSACARQLGPARSYFRTVDNAMDIDAVRRALGVARVGLFGVSYGTDVALTYARMFPTHVRRLLLDSVAAPLTSLLLVAEIAEKVPRTLRAFCAHVCVGATKDYARAAVSLARSLASSPLRGRVLELDGSRRSLQLTAPDLLGLLLSSDLSTGLAAELPAAVHAARNGDPSPLLRLDQLANPPAAAGETNAVYLATVCEDGPFPWQPDTPIAERSALLTGALARLPAASYGAFGPSAAKFGTASGCLRWPASSAPAPSVAAAYPDIPVLAVSGELDLRSPTFEARAVLTHFPLGQLLTVPNTGHAALGDSMSPCLSSAVRRWLSGRAAPRACPNPLLLAPLAAFPSDRLVRLQQPAETLALVVSTLHEAEASWALAPTVGAVPGLRAGRLTVTDAGFDLSGYSIAGGVALSGIVQVDARSDQAWSFAGVIRVENRAGTVGSLALNVDGLSGSLEGRLVRASRLASGGAQTRLTRPTPSWSTWTPPAGSAAEVASAIASHVGATYLAGPGGARLVAVGSAPAGSPRGRFGRPLSLIAVRESFRSDDLRDYRFSETSTTWTYSLCGRALHCSLRGEPTVTRAHLLSREGLELALYTFEFDPGVASVLIFLPPPPGDPAAATALYFHRSQLTRQLSGPLARTLTLTNPPLPTAPDPAESSTIDRLTEPHLYHWLVTNPDKASSELWLAGAA